jgi:hypothetical protein
MSARLLAVLAAVAEAGLEGCPVIAHVTAPDKGRPMKSNVSFQLFIITLIITLIPCFTANLCQIGKPKLIETWNFWAVVRRVTITTINEVLEQLDIERLITPACAQQTGSQCTVYILIKGVD